MLLEQISLTKMTTLLLLAPILIALIALVFFVILKLQNNPVLIPLSPGSETGWSDTFFPTVYSSVFYFYIFTGLAWFIVGNFGLDTKFIFLAPAIITISLLIIVSVLPAKNTALIKISPLFIYNLPGLTLHHFVEDSLSNYLANK